ncbi:MAG: class I mannose-6-phosphate isomerase [Firmicutes bacterium]|nr:class I mannose-6-phosphate isomerase [Bacillota bacterium]
MIVKLKPALKSYIWGGTALVEKYNKRTSLRSVAESWELSLHNDGLSVVDGGEFDGRYLRDAVSADDLGSNVEKFSLFPVLVKLIDSARPLSVQVHPDDGYASKNEGQLGKTEMWHILDAKAGAYVYLGTNRDVSSEEFASAVADNTVCDVLNRVEVAVGETYFIPSGTLHAIGEGVTLIEVQQNSSLTYRVYDYDRVDANGSKRELHISKARDVANLTRYCVPSPSRSELLGKCDYFAAYKYVGERKLFLPDSFCSITAVDGSVAVNDVVLRQGETAFVSAGERATVTGGAYVLVCVE